jgi:hypothetical protein
MSSTRERINRWGDIPPKVDEVTVEKNQVVTRILVYSTRKDKLKSIKEDIRNRKKELRERDYYIDPSVQ